MHIPENYLAPATCAVMTAAMVPVWVHSVKKVKKEIPKEKIPLLGVAAAFSFLGMMFNVPLIGGTTGHAVGGTLIALLFGPEASCIAVSIALLLQAVMFGDGGILAFGANCFNMAFVLPFAGYGIYRLIMKIFGKSDNNKFHYVAAAIGSYLGINLAALFAAVEFGLQPMIFKDSLGNALYCPYGLSISIPAMMIPHLAIAGVVEAIFTVAVYMFVQKTSPDLTYDRIMNENRSNPGESAPGVAKDNKVAAETTKNNDLSSDAIKDIEPVRENRKRFPIYLLVVALILATPVGLLATGTAWGEWGADEISQTAETGSALGYTPKGLAEGWSLDVIAPDYSMGGVNEVVAYILSAIIGTAILVIIFKLLSIPLGAAKKRKVGK